MKATLQIQYRIDCSNGEHFYAEWEGPIFNVRFHERDRMLDYSDTPDKIPADHCMINVSKAGDDLEINSTTDP